MLNRAKILKELTSQTGSLLSQYSRERVIAQILWKQIADDDQFASLIKSLDKNNFQFALPTWNGNLNVFKKIEPAEINYQIISTDGSQIYPDRHQGISCYVINIGTVVFDYHDKSIVTFDSQPYVTFASSQAEFSEQDPEFINCRRTELELRTGFELMQHHNDAKNKIDQIQSLYVCDGSLIFWHLQSQESMKRQRFLASYLTILQQFCQAGYLIAGYISLPKSKELVNLLRCAQKLGLVPSELQSFSFLHLADIDILYYFLPAGMRTPLFANQSEIINFYPDNVRPHFVYFNYGSEIGRIEFPAWVAQDEQKVDVICSLLYDQIIKGRGYPVCLSEAHEQAVIKQSDQDFFYHTIAKISRENKFSYSFSQKSLKKKNLGI